MKKKLKPIRVRSKINQVGNIVHESVVDSQDEENNELVRTWTQKITKPEQIAAATGAPAKLSHHEVLLRLDGYDPERGVRIVGHRGYFKKLWVFLNQALINYGLLF